MISILKRPQLAKELRPLLLPWLGAVVAGSLVALRPLIDGVGLESLLVAIVLYGFLGGLALVAAVTFGEEFQNRTLPLLLTQPVRRSRLWNQKMMILAAALVSALALEALLVAILYAACSSWHPNSERLSDWELILLSFSPNDALIGSAFLLGTVCSCGFWTLIARSTIGGLVFSVAAQCVTALGAALIFERVTGQSELFKGSAVFVVLALTQLAYSASFLWLGRRKFLAFELKDGRSEATSVSPRHWTRGLVGMLAIRPTRLSLNFIHKELGLLKPIGQIAGLFCLCWVGILLLQKLVDHPTTYLFDVLVCVYAPLTCLLAGCVSLGEEKALGLTETQLTLPFSTWRQWLLKLAVCGGTAALLSLGLPLLLFRSTGIFFDLSQSGLMNPDDRGMLALTILSGAAFLIAFWGIAHLANTVRAAIVTVGGIVALGLCFAFGMVLAEQTRGVVIGTLLTSIMTEFHLSPEVLQLQAARARPLFASAMAAGIILLLLYQGFRQFSRAQQRPRTLVANSLVLAALVASASFLADDYGTGLQRLPESMPIQELRHALNAIGRANLAPGPHVVQREDLIGRVSEQTLNWLRGAKVSYRALEARGHGEHTYQATIVFPDGSTFCFIGGFIFDRFGHWLPGG